MEILVIGLGSMGKRRIRLLKRFKEVSNIIGIDARYDRREETQKLFGCETFIDIDEAMRNHSAIKCAFVCTSPLSHSKLITNALNHNLDVFTEINLVSDGYERNIKLAKEKGKKLFLSSTMYYREEIQYLINQLRDKSKLNYIYHVGQFLPDWHPWENYKEFFVDDEKTNGCREIMAIELPWLLGTFGEVRKTNVLSDKISNLNLHYNDNYMIQIEHDNGNKGVLIIDVVSPKAVRNLEIFGRDIYFSGNGTSNSLECFDVKSKQIKKVNLYEKSENLEGYGSFIVENAYQN